MGRLKACFTSESGHVCREPEPATAKTLAVPFPADQPVGHLPLPLQPLRRHAVSILARQVETGVPVHRDLNVDEVVDVLSPVESQVGQLAVPRRASDWAAATRGDP